MADADLSSVAMQVVATVVASGFGSLIGYKLAVRSHVVEKRHDFIVEQLRDFYTPLLALRAQVVAKTERTFDVRHGYFDSEHFYKVVWPLYRKIATLFSTNLWLASPATRKFYDEVAAVIEGFEYDLANGFLDEFEERDIERFKKLDPFYQHLREKLDELQRALLLSD